MNYKKKLYFVLLFTLSLTFLLGISSTSLGWSYDLTVSDIRNINETLGSVQVNENFYTKCQQFLDLDYDVYFYTVYDNKKTARLIGWYDDAVQTNSTNVYCSLKANTGNYGYCSQYNNGNVNYTAIATGGYSFRFNSNWTNQNYWFVSGNYRNLENTVLREQPYQSVNILTLTEPTNFEFINTQNYRLVQVQTQADGYLYYDIPVAWTNKIIGTLNKSIFCDRVWYRASAYNKNTNQFEIIADNVTLWQYSDGNNISNFYNTDTSTTYWSSVIDFNIYRLKNCCVYLFFEHSNSTGSDLVVPIYVSDTNTRYSVATGGGLIVSADDTFSGDYLNNYDNDINNVVNEQPINDIANSIDNINDTLTDDSEVDAILDEFASGDLGEKWGFSPLTNPFYSFLYDLYSGFLDCLLGNENVTLNLNIFGRTVVLHSEDFITPQNDLINFVKNVLTAFFIYLAAKHFYKVIVSFEVGNATQIKDNLNGDPYYNQKDSDWRYM